MCFFYFLKRKYHYWKKKKESPGVWIQSTHVNTIGIGDLVIPVLKRQKSNHWTNGQLRPTKWASPRFKWGPSHYLNIYKMANSWGKHQMANPSQVFPHMEACLHTAMQATFTHTQTQKETKLQLGWCFTVYKWNIATSTRKGKNWITYVDNKSLHFAKIVIC